MRLHPSCEVLGKPNNKDIAATAHADAWRMHYASLCYVENFPSFHMTSIDITSLKNNQIVRQIFPEGFIVGCKGTKKINTAKKFRENFCFSFIFIQSPLYIFDRWDLSLQFFR